MKSKQIIKSWPWRIARAGHNQKTFSAKCGVHETSLSTYIKGKTVPTFVNFNKIEDTLLDIEGA